MEKAKGTKKRIKLIQPEQLIADAIVAFLKENNGLKCPSRKDIVKLTGLSIRTVDRHYKKIQFKPLDTTLRALSPLVLNNLFAQTVKSTQAVKLWLQVIEGWREESEYTVPKGLDKMQDNFDSLTDEQVDIIINTLADTPNTKKTKTPNS